MSRLTRNVRDLGRHLRFEPVATVAGLTALPVLDRLLKSERLTMQKYFAWVRARWVPTSHEPVALQIPQAKRIAGAIYFGASVWRLTESSCLARSALLWTMCRRANLDAEVAIGMDPEDFGSAHAWVELGSVPIDDTIDVTDRYGRLDPPLSRVDQTTS